MGYIIGGSCDDIPFSFGGVCLKVLFTHDYGEEKFSEIESLGYEVKYIGEKDLIESDEIYDIDALVCYNPFGKVDIDKMEKLKLIQLSSVGVDQVPVDKVLRNDILVSNNRGGYSIPMGEWIVCKILDIFKESKTIYENQRNHSWELIKSLEELPGKSVGFIGTGTISSEGAKRLQGFDVNIIGYSRNGKDREHFDKVYKIDKLKESIGELDIVIIALPLTDETMHMFDYELLNQMKNDSVLINVSRGELLIEEDLIDFLDKGKFKGVALDVVRKEPLSVDSKLWDYNNVHISSHNSWLSEMRNIRRYNTILSNLKSLIRGEKLINVVDIKKGY